MGKEEEKLGTRKDGNKEIATEKDEGKKMHTPKNFLKKEMLKTILCVIRVKIIFKKEIHSNKKQNNQNTKREKRAEVKK